MTLSLSDNDERHFCRVPFVSTAYLSLDEQCWKCRLLDISLKGVLIEYSSEFEINNNALYSISLIISEELVINMQAKIIHTEEHYIGLQWLKIDLDSLTVLRRLLELNLSDSEEINRELAMLIHSNY